jgi:ABC-type Fe3+-hydroxamate transport system substrate-binding protein
MGHTSIEKSFVRLSLVVAVAWFSAPGSAGGITVKDATGRPVAISDATRIVSVGGAVTEILYALGLEQRVIAVDTTSLYPPRALAEKPNVGYMRQLSPEGVLALGPSSSSPPRAPARRKRSPYWKRHRFHSFGSPTGSPARASSRKSA